MFGYRAQIAACEVCGSDYRLSFEVHAAGAVHVFDSFECAIHRLAPVCDNCGCKVIGHRGGGGRCLLLLCELRPAGEQASAADLVGCCGVVGSVDVLKPGSAGLGSDRTGQFGGCSRDPHGGRSLDTKLVVPAPQVLHEGLPGDDYLRRLICSQPRIGRNRCLS